MIPVALVSLSSVRADPAASIINPDVARLLDRYCGACHRAENSQGKWAFDRYVRQDQLVADQASWRKVQLAVTHHTMPPAGEDVPLSSERQQIADWIEDTVFAVDPGRPDPGPAPLRRVNRVEYRNSVRDVFLLEFDPTTGFPADDSGYGFDNIAEVLSFSPLHYEKYLAAAKAIAENVTTIGPPPRVGIELNADKLSILAGRAELRDNRIWLRTSQDRIGTQLQIPVESEYRVLVRAASLRDESGNPRPFLVFCDGKLVGEVATSTEFQGKPGAQGTAFALLRLPQGSHQIAVALGEPPKIDDPSVGTASTLGTVGFLSISGPFTPTAPAVSPFLSRFLADLPADSPSLRLSGEDLDQGSGKNSLDTGRAWFSSKGYRHAPVLIKESGNYLLRFKVGAQQVGDEPTRFEVRLGDKSLGLFEVTAQSQAEQWIETTKYLEAGLHDWQVWFDNAYTDPVTGAERWFWLHEFTLEGPREQNFGISAQRVTDILQDTAKRLFRRPLSDDESGRLSDLVRRAMDAGLSPRSALGLGLETLLVSPNFLYHPKPKSGGDEKDGTMLVDEFTLASRLASFLWCSLPDATLVDLADRGELRAHLPSQVDRMLADPKASALTSNFAGQWLQLRNLEVLSLDKALFPEFDGELAEAMRRESELVFETILNENRSVLEFLSADYTFLNDRLARHYGIARPLGPGFTRISLADPRRRGVITHASILSLTSLPTRTSPVKRGKWVLEQFFGVEPPPQPAGVPPLPAEAEDLTLSLRQRLEQHAGDRRCASCHALLDPIGFALENYDAIGRWRTVDADKPIDPSGITIEGQKFNDWLQLRDKLVEQESNVFVRSFVQQLLTYALGRGVTYRDKTAIQSIINQSAASRHGFQHIIHAICQSVPFQRCRMNRTAPDAGVSREQR